MLRVDSAAYSAYEAPNLQNVEFFYGNGTLVPSWLESGNSYTASDTIYWLRVASVPAQSSLVIYMGFGPTAVNLLNSRTTGEAPQLSPVYGQYDDGAAVFRFYDNFAGTSYNSTKWNPVSDCSGTGSVDNGASVPAEDCVSTVQQFSASNYTMEAYGRLIANPTGAGADVYDFAAANVGYSAGTGNRFGLQTSNASQAFQTQPPSGQMLVWTLGATPSMLYAEYNYSNQIQVANPSPDSSAALTIFSGYYVGETVYTQWIRVRATPPNDVMPTVSQLSVSSTPSLPSNALLPIAVGAAVLVVALAVLALRRRKGGIRQGKDAPAAIPKSEVVSSGSGLTQEMPRKEQETSGQLPQSKLRNSVCFNCGGQLLPEDTFCGKCGAKRSAQ